jgi:pimeloyl-ACP methyl ester carboxylesterase
VTKQSTPAAVPPGAVRTRRAYFDCRYGQLHVRTAFPATGGFDEQVTLFCLHPSEGSSRTFGRFLPEIAEQRSVYAPDLPGFGESDPPPGGVPSLPYAEAARVISSLAADLRLRRIDLFGVGFGAAVALELGAARADLVRRLVLMRVPPADRIPTVKQESLVLSADLLDTAPETLARQISAFLETKIGGIREAQ